MNEYFNTKIRSDLLTLKTLDKTQILGIIDNNITNFERRPMEDFKYLLKERKYSPWLIAFMVLLQLGMNIAIWLIIANNSEITSIRRYYRF